MSIIRAPRPESNWYQLDKRISEDSRLSWAARGLLVYLLGKPDNWRVSIEHLRKQTENARLHSGRDALYALLGELKEVGYITAHQQHRNGRLGSMDYTVRELPDYPEAVQRAAQQHTANPTLTRIEGATRKDTSEAAITEEASSEATNRGAALACIAPFADHHSGIREVLADLVIDPDVFRDFVMHVEEAHAEQGNTLTAERWFQIVKQLERIQREGSDLDNAATSAILAGRDWPVDTDGDWARVAAKGMACGVVA